MKRDTGDLTPWGWVVAAAVGVLVTIGLLSIYVTDTHYVSGHDGPANASRQATRIAVGIAMMLVILRIGYHRVGRYALGLFLISLVALIPLLAARLLHSNFGGLTTPRNGAYRWIHLPGLLLQPSEVMKLAYVLALAWHLRYRRDVQRFAGLLVPLLASAVPLGLILLEPDLGTALLLIPLGFSLLYTAGARLRHLAAIAVCGVAAAPFAWGHIAQYQRLRVTSVLLQSDGLRKAVIEHPEDYTALATRRQAIEWSASSGYQLVHSKNAIGSGGILGHGWGKGAYVEAPLLPDRHNDFVFAVVAHQWGFIGCLVVLACYLVIVFAGVRIASATIEPFARLLAVGLTTLIAAQALVNVGMSTGVLPVTGMTLPFVSYGGSSLLCNFAAVALLISVARHNPYLLTRDPFTFGREHHESLAASHAREPAPPHPPVAAR
ncbi:MAG: FtsW/RodA/SpoVE family cell cycle protein [Planctomycetota bacterium]